MKIEIKPVQKTVFQSWDDECEKRRLFINELHIALYSFFPAVTDIRYERHNTNEWLIIEYSDGGEIRQSINDYSLIRLMGEITEHLK